MPIPRNRRNEYFPPPEEDSTHRQQPSVEEFQLSLRALISLFDLIMLSANQIEEQLERNIQLMDEVEDTLRNNNSALPLNNNITNTESSIGANTNINNTNNTNNRRSNILTAPYSSIFGTNGQSLVPLQVVPLNSSRDLENHNNTTTTNINNRPQLQTNTDPSDAFFLAMGRALRVV